MLEGAPINLDLRLDHAVIAVADLAAAMADYEALGFTVRFGGEHPGRRTHNALIYFADGSYLELIAERLELPPTDDERENWIRMAPVREGSILLTYALRTGGSGGDDRRLRAARLDPGGTPRWRAPSARWQENRLAFGGGGQHQPPFHHRGCFPARIAHIGCRSGYDACQRRVGCAAGRVAGGGCRENRGGICAFARAKGRAGPARWLASR